MKDRVFYPLAILIVAAMIWLALSFQVDNAPANADIYLRSEAELEELFPSPGTTSVIENSGQGMVAKLSAHMSREIAPPSAGVFGTLGPVHEENFGGANIRITARARKAPQAPSSQFELGYFTSGVGDSEWQRFDLTNEFADYSFEFSPNPPLERGNDYVGIWPDPSGKGGSIELLLLKVERLR